MAAIIALLWIFCFIDGEKKKIVFRGFLEYLWHVFYHMAATVLMCSKKYNYLSLRIKYKIGCGLLCILLGKNVKNCSFAKTYLSIA